MNKISLLLCLLTIAACTSVEVKEQAACERMGITPDNPRFDSCMDRMEMRRQANMAASLGMMNAGAGLLQPQPNVVVYSPMW